MMKQQKQLILFFILALSSMVCTGAEIKKIIDANGHVMYTNLSDPSNGGFRGKIVKRIDTDGITYFRNIRTSLAKHAIKTGLNKYSYRSSSYLPTLFHRFSDNYGSRSYDNKSKYSNLIADAASRHGVEEKLVHAVIQTESAYNASAVSPAGAVGLMQLMPGTARRYGVTDRNDPSQNINGGTRYLKDLLDMFNYNLGLAVAAYNAGENAVIRHNNSIPPYRETQNYVRQVLSLYHRHL
jgi:soluble lytic murein transglycosylase-like protein